MVGTVADAKGEQLPSTTVTARNLDTGLTRTVVTGADGSYRVEAVPTGRYSIEVEATSGFKKAFRDDIVLQVNDTLRIDFALEVGQVNETVTITDETPQINTSTPELGRTVQPQEIENLPLVERNVYALLDLTPGVQSNNTGVSTSQVGGNNFSFGYPEQRTLINGGTDSGTGSVSYYLDGGVNMTSLRNTGNVAPNPEAIQEFKVTTNSYGAEYGRFASGVVNILTKSGTNQVHGSLYEFVRNTAFNANDFGSPSRPPYHRNQFGGSIGGPLPFFNFGEGGPMFKSGKDRTFFFFTYSGLRQITNSVLTGAIVPTALERTGDFSQSGTRPRDPRTGTTAANSTLFAGGIIPANRLDPVALRILNTYIPAANQPGNRWAGIVPNPYNTNEYLIKLDHQLTQAHRLSLTYFNTAGTITVFPGSGNLPWATQNYKWQQHNVNLSDVWVISPNKVNQTWVTFMQNFGNRLNVPGTTLQDLGSAFLPQGLGSLPQISVTGGNFSLSNAIGGPSTGTNLYSVRNIFSWTKGRHTIKLGGELSLNKDIQVTLLNNYGVFSFNGTASGNALADFLLGIPNSVSQDTPVTAYTNNWYTALFAQDDFRVSSKLTLNLGLRWDVQTPSTDPLNRFVNYVPGQKSIVRPDAPVGALFFGDPGVERGAIPISYTHFSPRLGLAYDPFGDGKTSIRAAGGLFYGSISGNEWNQMTNLQPWATRLSFTNINRNGSGATLSNPYANYPGGTPFPYTGGFTNGGGFLAVDPDFKFPRTFQMNISVQRQITEGLAMTVAYVKSAARDLPFGRDVNAPIPNATASAVGSNILARRPNPAFGAVNVIKSDQSADYNGLQISGQMRFSRRIRLNGFYVLSKTTSSAALHGNGTQGGVQNNYDLEAENGAADTDQRHVFNMSFNFQPDLYSGDSRILKGIINGWSVAPIIKIRSGRPFTVTNGNIDANLDGVPGTDRANLIGDPYLENPTSDRWFNTDAFSVNPIVIGVSTNGTSPRNVLYGPGFQAVDLALSRDFKIGERYKLRLRGEGTNIFNKTNLGQPNGNAAAGTNFGRITSAYAKRIIQLGFRFTF